MEKVKLGVIREGKQPPDRRVPLTPMNCKALLATYPQLEIVVQTSQIRGYTDEEYTKEGITVQEDISDCDVLMGVKEVPMADLVPGKKYFFFSHTIKEQPYNKKLLKTILDNKIQLIDYECLPYSAGMRIIGFGRYAGIVGAYNAMIGYGKKTGLYDLKPAHECRDLAEMLQELTAVELPNIKIVLTGEGRVGKGAKEIMEAMDIQKVSPQEYLNKTFDHPVFCQLGVMQYNRHKEGLEKDNKYFYKNPKEYESSFLRYTEQSDVFVSCHFWDPNSPRLFEKDQVESPKFNIKVIADITCDIEGSIPTTLAPSTIMDPFYGYNPQSHQVDEAFSNGSITVMAVDNLPCELPRDASEGFGNDLLKSVLPHLLGGDTEGIIQNASITKDGELTEKYKYLNDYANC